MTVREELEIRHKIILKKAQQGDFMSMICHTDKSYQAQDFHKRIASALQRFLIDPDFNKLAIFLPPQHGKSELTSRKFAPHAFGINPDLKIALASYSSDLANSFNRDIQKVIDSDEYREIFPNATINSRNVVTTQSWLRNSEVFEIVGKKGFFKSIGVTGGLSGVPVDIAIIDDPVKDDIEAQSPTYRERVWNWYISVLLARLHNKSKQLLIMTRWHEDDLGGRILNPKINPNAHEWHVIKIPAIKEDNSDPEDKRAIGEALWPDRHNLNKLEAFKSLSENIFQSLYQQNPVPRGGLRIARDAFKIVDELPVRFYQPILFIDGAYTDNQKNDPTGIMDFYFDVSKQVLYVTNFQSLYYEMPQLLEYLKVYGSARNVKQAKIEPKASGHTLQQMMNKETKIPASLIQSKLVSQPKDAAFGLASIYIESGKLQLVKGEWNDALINQMCSFPKAAHDEAVDLLGLACDHFFKTNIYDNFTGKDNLL